jgi:hypothetical protein
MTQRKPAAARTVIRGKGWNSTITVAAEKFEPIAAAILKSLSAEPIRLTELVNRVAARLPDFEGSVSWYTITVVHELETRGQVVRHKKPVLYSLSRPTRGARKTASRTRKT